MQSGCSLGAGEVVLIFKEQKKRIEKRLILLNFYDLVLASAEVPSAASRSSSVGSCYAASLRDPVGPGPELCQ